MAGKRKTKRRRAGTSLSIAVLAGLTPVAASVIAGFQEGLPGGPGVAVGEAGRHAMISLTGYDPELKKWKLGDAKGGMALLTGIFAHKLAGRLGINRAIANMGVPLFRI